MVEEELTFPVEIQGKKLVVQELTIENSDKFIKFFLKAFTNIDFGNLENPIDLLGKASEIASKNFPDFAQAIFAGQDTAGIKWNKCKFGEAVKIIGFFFKCNSGSLSGLTELFQSLDFKKEAEISTDLK